MSSKRRLFLAAAGAALAMLSTPAAAQYPPPPLQPLYMTAVGGKQEVRSGLDGVFNGVKVRYDAEIFETIVRDREQKPAASILAISYAATNQGDPKTRPVIFAFNGGPGGPAVYLHLGALGPKVFLTDDTDAKLAPNPQSPLDAADLVFLDPPETGFSHVLPGADAKQFYSIDGDSEAMGQAVVTWLRSHGRLASPVYLMGESYGTMRAVAMARDLARGAPSIKVAGLMLTGNSLGYLQKGQMPDILYWANALPMMASVAWRHGKIDNKGQTWTQAVDKARLYARTSYIGALMQGYELDAATKAQIARELPAIIGIPEAYFRTNKTIVIPERDFLRELLRTEGRVVDGNDGRVTYLQPPGPPPREAHFKHYGDALDTYLASDLKFRGLPAYVPINPTLSRGWNFYTAGAMALDVTLASSMKADPNLRVMLVQGRHDTLTTIGNSEYIMRQADLARDRYQIAYYDGGHAVEPDREIMDAIRRFVRAR